jgi:hypothetical protein
MIKINNIVYKIIDIKLQYLTPPSLRLTLVEEKCLFCPRDRTPWRMRRSERIKNEDGAPRGDVKLHRNEREICAQIP